MSGDPAPWMSTVLDAPEAQLYGVSSQKDRAYWDGLEAVLAAHPHGQRHILTHWPAYTKRVSLARFLAHHELFRRTLEVPGSIVELGVSRGVSFFTWHKLLEVFAPMDTAKKVYGFDSFEGLTDFREEDGAARIDDAANDKRPNGWSAAAVEAEIFALAALANADNVVARERSRLIKGRIQDTLEPFLEATPGLRISLLHFDLDLYEPTLYALERLWDLVTPGGVVIFDEYALPPWAGEAAAFDAFARRRGLKAELKTLPWCLTPSAYLVKTDW